VIQTGIGKKGTPVYNSRTKKLQVLNIIQWKGRNARESEDGAYTFSRSTFQLESTKKVKIT
jgi:hypothetical protein